MDELIDRLAAKAGIEKAVAEKTVGATLRFLRKEGPAGQMQALFGKIPRTGTLGLSRFT